MKLAADANVLLSAVLGGRAKLILQRPEIEEVLTAEKVVAELEEYAPYLARKRGLNAELVLLAVSALPVTIIGRAGYAAALAEAEARIGSRDPDDVDLLALALQFRLPVWSNDNDFADSGVEWYTTAQLLKLLKISGRG
jgi:predicted nucleic acid-binding protein